MNEYIMFLLNSMFLGFGLSMDAFSVSMADGLNEPYMKREKSVIIAGTFAFFQALMPLTGWFCVHTMLERFNSVKPFIPWVSLIFLCLIGWQMISDGFKCKCVKEEKKLCFKILLLQGVATSIDALSIGFTIAELSFLPALVCSLIIAFVTLAVCLTGVSLGKKAGKCLSGKAMISGGVILIIVGLEIFIKNTF